MSTTGPLTLTFDEARALLAKNGRRLLFLVEHIDSNLTVVNEDWTVLATGAMRLSERVVARDEVAELKSAIRKWSEAEAAVTTGMDDDDVNSGEFLDCCVRLKVAQAELRRLVASEGQP